MVVLTLLLLLMASTEVFAQGRLIPNPVRNIPRWVRNEFDQMHLGERYNVVYRFYPYTLRGDFNGDGRKDVAIQIQDKHTEKHGIAIFHTKRPQAIATPLTIIGAGKPLGKAGDDLRWAGVWSLVIRRDANRQARSSRHAQFEGDVIALEKRDSTGTVARGGLIYWDSTRYDWSERGQHRSSK